MPQTFIPGVIRAIILGSTIDETQQLNVIHCLSVNPVPTIDDVQAVAEAVTNWIESDYIGIVGAGVQFLGVHARGMNALVAAKYQTTMTGVSGTLAGEMLPYYVSLPSQWTTGTTGPATRGMFFPFTPTESANDSIGHPSTGYVSAVVTALATLRGDMASAGFPLVVASFKYSLVRAITGNGVTPRWGSQIHRKIGRGR